MNIEKIPENQVRYCENCIESKKAKFFLQLKHTFSIYFCESCFDYLQKLEKPKTKVKKWQWLVISDRTKHIRTTTHCSTKEEISDIEYDKQYFTVLYKIPESEIEVEE